MKKKAFTAPFWMMLVAGVLCCYFDAVWARYVYRLTHFRLFILLAFVWPFICFAESIVYWQIRYKNKQRSFSWLHVVLFSLAVLSPFLMRGIALGLKYRILYHRFIRIEFYYFWLLQILAHVFFTVVIVRAYAKELVAKGGEGNLLDDVLD